MLGGQRNHVPDATRLVTDKFATQYWDGLGFTIGGYRSVLSTPGADMGPYLWYGPDAKCDARLSATPDYGMHQLGDKSRPRVAGPCLDGKVFATKTTELP